MRHTGRHQRYTKAWRELRTTNIRLRATETELMRLVIVIIHPEKEWRLMLDDTKKCDKAKCET